MVCGSTLTLSLSRIAQRSLTLRPAGLQPALSRLLSRQLRRVGYPSRRDDSYQDGSTVSWVGLTPTGITQFHMTHSHFEIIDLVLGVLRGTKESLVNAKPNARYTTRLLAPTRLGR